MNSTIESVMEDIAGFTHCLESQYWSDKDKAFLDEKLAAAQQKLKTLMADDENVFQVKDVTAYVDFEAAAKLVAGVDYPPDLWDAIAGMSVFDAIKYIWRTTGMKLNTSKDLYHFLASKNMAVTTAPSSSTE